MVTSPTKAGVLAAAIILPCADTIAVGLRFYVRRMKRTRIGGDDWMIAMALVSLIAERQM